jgi:hypothetical protein
MKEKEQERIEMDLTMTFDNKEALKEFIDNFGKAIAKEQAEALKDLYKEQFETEKKLKVFQPQKGDICTCIIEDSVDAIFRYSGKTRTDEDGTVWLDGDLGLTWSGDLFKPYLIIHGEDSEYHRGCCRPATEKEIALFRNKVKEYESAKGKEGKKWNVGDWVYVVGSETGCSKVFYAVPVTYADTKTMENLVRRGWVFDKESDCQAVCDKLNEAIKNVKL